MTDKVYLVFRHIINCSTRVVKVFKDVRLAEDFVERNNKAAEFSESYYSKEYKISDDL